ALASTEPEFILNRFQARHTISEKQLESTFGRALYAILPRDDKAIELAELSGKDLWEVAPNSPLAHSYESLAGRLVNTGQAVKPERNGFIAKLRSAFGAHAG